MENDIVQPNIDHVEEAVIKWSRLAWLGLEQAPLSQELLQHRPWQRSIGDRGRVMRVEVRCMDPDGFDCFMVPSPKVILGLNGNVSPSAHYSLCYANPEDIPPRRCLGLRHSHQPVICRLQGLLASQHQPSDPNVPLVSDRTLRQASRIPRHIIDVGEEPVSQHICLGPSFLQIVLSIALHDSFDVRQAFGDQPLVHPQESRERDGEVPVVIYADHVTVNLDSLGVYESHSETAAELETLPDEVAARYHS